MRQRWNHNIEYHRVVLDSVPPGCASALDVGCGEGVLARELARYAERVTGVDVDARIIGAARQPPQPANVTFLHADVMTHPFAPGTFDLISSVATLHHLPLDAAIMHFAHLLAPGGVLAVIGLYRSGGAADAAYATAGFLASHARRRLSSYEPMHAPIKAPEQTLDEIRDIARHLLPGSRVQRRLFFRYSLLWKKEGSSVL